jgi:purine-cytosine permease-like protein
MAFLAAGVKIPFALRRALIALGFGVIGFFIALAAVLNGGFAALYEDFLLIIAYWIAPWLGVVFADRWLRRGTSISAFIPASALSQPGRTHQLPDRHGRVDLAVLEPDPAAGDHSRRRSGDR